MIHPILIYKEEFMQQTKAYSIQRRVIIDVYESLDFVDLGEVYGFSQTCSLGTEVSNCDSPFNAGMLKKSS